MIKYTWRKRLVAVLCTVGCAAGLATTTASPAAATVNENRSWNNEPDWNPAIDGHKAEDVVVLSFNKVSTDAVVSVQGGHDSPNTMANNGVVSLWTKGYEDSSHGVVNDNETWEYVPTGDGWFWLRSRISGKCLDVTSASTATGAGVAQYDCMDDFTHFNQQWRMTSGRLQVRHSGAFLAAVGTTTADNRCVPSGGVDGATLKMGYADLADTPSCDAVSWNGRQPYRYATNKVVETPDIGSTIDNARYRCMKGYDWNGYDDSISDIRGAYDPAKNWQGLKVYQAAGSPTTYVEYDNKGLGVPYYAVGQVYLFCKGK